MIAEIVSVGDELLIGDTVNSNAAWLGEVLAERGLKIRRVHTVGDDGGLIIRTLEAAEEEAELVIVTGGLGPTHDDVTKKAVAALYGVSMRTHRPTLDFIRKVFEKRNIPFTRSNYLQAEVPENAEVLFNTQGTAPGLWIEEGGTLLVVLPGVPHEMKHLVREEVIPRLEKREKVFSRPFRYYITTAGIGESTLSDEIIGDLDSWLDDSLSVAYLPYPGGVRIRILGRGDARPEGERIQSLLKHIRRRADIHIIGEGDKVGLPEALGSLLRERGLTISLAESCSGGLICDALTDVPGSSDYLLGGTVAYANRIKTELLGVSSDTLANHGAVSCETALEMAKGASDRFGSDTALSATGIAGPGGGSRQKPVGTVWVGYRDKERHFAVRARFTNNRRINKERTAALALDIARRALQGIDTMPYGLEARHA